MSNDTTGKALTTPPTTSISLTPTTSMDLSFLSEHERAALLKQHATGMLDIARKAQELQVDVAVLQKTLGELSATTKEVSEAGNAVTITHTQTTKIGRTEIIMGNTAKAESGKIDARQAGVRDWTPIYVIGGLIALVFIAYAFMR